MEQSPRPVLSVNSQSVSIPRSTIAQTAEIHGRGIHSGAEVKLSILPAPANTGIVFRRVDLPSQPGVSVCYDNLAADELDRRTTLRSGACSVHTVEHLLSALCALGIHDAVIEMNAPEPPGLDGSGLGYVQAIEAAGVRPHGADEIIQPLIIDRAIAFQLDGSEICAIPAPDFRVTFFYTSEEPLLRTQTQSFAITPQHYKAEIAPARTFCFFREIEALQKANLIKGGSLACAVVIGRKSILNTDLRYRDEPVRHKILDFIGDMALLGVPLQGHFLAWRAGHRINAAFGQHLKKEYNL